MGRGSGLWASLQQMVSIPLGSSPRKGDLSQEAGLSAPSVSSNTSVPNCLRFALGVHTPSHPV